ncbi:MAG: peptidoglycan-binding protein [Demequina sp.]|nr:peptidoglycan-binding protein [Demequina sp.]
MPNVAYDVELADGRVLRGTTGNTGLFRTSDGPAGNARVRYRPNARGEGGAQLASFPGTHEVRQGQDMVSIAWAYGRTDWETIWSDSHNDAMRESHNDPNVLMPGTRVYIPEDDREPESFAMGQRHEITIEVPRVHVRVQVKMFNGDPFADRAFVLTWTGTEMHAIEGKRTNGNGWVDEWLPIHARDATLWIAGLAPIRLGLRLLDPLRDPVRGEANVAGVQARLNHLGYIAGPVDGVFGHRTREAVAVFQANVMGHDAPNGEPDAVTLDALLGEASV